MEVVCQGSKLTFSPTCPMGRWLSFLVALTTVQTFFKKHSYNISNMILNMFMIDAQYNDINSLGSVAHICALLFRTFGVHSAYMRTWKSPRFDFHLTT